VEKTKGACSGISSAVSCAWCWKRASRLRRVPYRVVRNPCQLRRRRRRRPTRWQLELQQRTRRVFAERCPRQQRSEVEERAKRFRNWARRNRERRESGGEKGERKPAPPDIVGRCTRRSEANRCLWEGASPVIKYKPILKTNFTKKTNMNSVFENCARLKRRKEKSE